MPLKILNIQTVVKETESGAIINISYDGEFPDGTKVSRTIMGVQDRLSMVPNPDRAVVDLVVEDLRTQWNRRQAEQARIARLKEVAETVSAVNIEVPIEVPETPPAPETTEEVVEATEATEETTEAS